MLQSCIAIRAGGPRLACRLVVLSSLNQPPPPAAASAFSPSNMPLFSMAPSPLGPSASLASFATAAALGNMEDFVAGHRPRVCIVGAGVAGLALAGSLSALLPRAKIEVFERADEQRDEGYNAILWLQCIRTHCLPSSSILLYFDQRYGLDLDEHGQEALALAGLTHKYWDISRPYSDVFKLYNIAMQPLFIKFAPRLLAKFLPKLFPPRPESNRAMLRQVLLRAAVDRGVKVTHGVAVAGIGRARLLPVRQVEPSEHCGLVDVWGADGACLSEGFGLVVDCSGLHSPLRGYRVCDTEQEAQLGGGGGGGGGVEEGDGGLCEFPWAAVPTVAPPRESSTVLVHGVIEDLERAAEARGAQGLGLVEAVGEGTLVVMGRGYQFCLQRFGADPADKRTAFFYMIWPGQGQRDIASCIGLPAATTRDRGNFRGQELEKIKRWLKADMGGEQGEFHPLLLAAVDCLDRACVRPTMDHTHPTFLRRDVEHWKRSDARRASGEAEELLPPLPIICIGDSLRNIGLGGGGNLALRDAVELTKLLAQPGFFAPPRPFPPGLPRVSLERLRELEEAMLDRKASFFARRLDHTRGFMTRRPGSAAATRAGNDAGEESEKLGSLEEKSGNAAEDVERRVGREGLTGLVAAEARLEAAQLKQAAAREAWAAGKGAVGDAVQESAVLDVRGILRAMGVRGVSYPVLAAVATAMSKVSLALHRSDVAKYGRAGSSPPTE